MPDVGRLVFSWWVVTLVLLGPAVDELGRAIGEGIASLAAGFIIFTVMLVVVVICGLVILFAVVTLLTERDVQANGG